MRSLEDVPDLKSESIGFSVTLFQSYLQSLKTKNEDKGIFGYCSYFKAKFIVEKMNFTDVYLLVKTAHSQKSSNHDSWSYLRVQRE